MGEVALKLDMRKVYDRRSGRALTKLWINWAFTNGGVAVYHFYHLLN